MLIVFKAEGAADVMMFGDVAKALMSVMGKEPTERGVITFEQLPGAIERLRKAVARDKAEPQVLEPESGAERKDEEGKVHVRLTQRALPLIDLLEHARREEVPVVWGI